MITYPFSTKVVGVSFVDGYPHNLHRIANDAAHGHEGVAVFLQREPDNPYDPNAIAVLVATTDTPANKVGHLPRDLAAKFAASLDKNPDGWRATLESVDVIGDHPERPGLTIRIYPKETS
jgi:hypothetical protein